MKKIILPFLLFSILFSCKDDKVIKTQGAQTPVKNQVVKDSAVSDEVFVRGGC